MNEIITVTMYTPDGGTHKFTKGGSIKLAADNLDGNLDEVTIDKIDIDYDRPTPAIIIDFSNGSRGTWFAMTFGVLTRPLPVIKKVKK